MTASGSTRYNVERSWLGVQPVVVLHDHAGNRHVRVALHGASLLGFEVPFGDGLHDLADGYRDADEVQSSENTLRANQPQWEEHSIGSSRSYPARTPGGSGLWDRVESRRVRWPPPG